MIYGLKVIHSKKLKKAFFTTHVNLMHLSDQELNEDMKSWKRSAGMKQRIEELRLSDDFKVDNHHVRNNEELGAIVSDYKFKHGIKHLGNKPKIRKGNEDL
ncbi:hypothetical protein FM038_014050 [Shewanella eurypsychrophilus]|uniref:Uncharacterized protein n=1 Tax=Shewanella eurypsychrophilus TaxID=2593656 RepID=A0ABX6V9B6_9GAMM|nr:MULTISPECIES: hypothetical protein [Shewanella]QFU23157.1 hypothetical protein FS418_15630 [Shewanella sp. YLB-09]QPG58440.1 hypothetical protein FM038_014050 [Shewanella eurypsychrophilus]